MLILVRPHNPSTTNLKAAQRYYNVGNVTTTSVTTTSVLLHCYYNVTTPVGCKGGSRYIGDPLLVFFYLLMF